MDYGSMLTFRRRRNSAFILALCTSCFALTILLSGLFRDDIHADESVGQWVFVPSEKKTYVSPEGLTYPDPSEDANDIFPNNLKTYTSKGTWVYLRNPGVEIPQLTQPTAKEGINWGTLDCGFHGPKSESRALGCDRPGKAYEN